MQSKGWKERMRSVTNFRISSTFGDFVWTFIPSLVRVVQPVTGVFMPSISTMHMRQAPTPRSSLMWQRFGMWTPTVAPASTRVMPSGTETAFPSNSMFPRRHRSVRVVRAAGQGRPLQDRLFGDEDSALGADPEALAAMGAAALPYAVGREARLARRQLLAFDGEVLARFAALVAHGALGRIDLVADEIFAFAARADAFNMPVKLRGMGIEEGSQDVGVVLALLAHAPVLDINGDAPELCDVLLLALPGLDRLEDFHGVIDAQLAGMALRAHAVLGVVVIEELELQLRCHHGALTFLLRHGPLPSRSPRPAWGRRRSRLCISCSSPGR